MPVQRQRMCRLENSMIKLAAMAAIIITAVTGVPLEFGNLNGTESVTGNSEISCDPNVPDVCRLTRTSFGGIPVTSSLVVTSSGRIVRIIIIIDELFFDRTQDVLIDRYGSSESDEIENLTNRTGGAYQSRTIRWTSFDDDAELILYRNGDRGTAMVNFFYPSNAAQQALPTPDF